MSDIFTQQNLRDWWYDLDGFCYGELSNGEVIGPYEDYDEMIDLLAEEESGY